MARLIRYLTITSRGTIFASIPAALAVAVYVADSPVAAVALVAASAGATWALLRFAA